MLIEIEKRVSELEKIKKDREEKSLASAIPATAFGLRGGGGAGAIGGMNPPIMENGSAMPVPAPVVFQPSETEISGIIGANGIYVAQVKADDGQIRQARVGDKLPDGSIVQSISTHGVTALKNGKIRTLHVKDVGTIFGGQ